MKLIDLKYLFPILAGLTGYGLARIVNRVDNKGLDKDKFERGEK